MRAYWIRPPGQDGGPCLSQPRGLLLERCDHPACESARAVAELECNRCGEPIGYGAPLIFEKVYVGEALQARHERC
jgi:hypothetical protein